MVHREQFIGGDGVLSAGQGVPLPGGDGLPAGGGHPEARAQNRRGGVQAARSVDPKTQGI